MGARRVRKEPSVLLLAAASALAAHLACGGAPAGPTTPIPTPEPTPIPTPTPDPSIPPEGSGCGEPYPPPLREINVKIHVKAPEYWTLDSTPLVGPDAGYCAAIGYTDFRSYCPVRQERDPERGPCEAWVMGNAKDTGTPGPTWYWEWEQYCTDLEKDGCEHDPTNPYSLRVLKPGWYQACQVDKDVCGETEVDK
jgi:hypothetical protein